MFSYCFPGLLDNPADSASLAESVPGSAGLSLFLYFSYMSVSKAGSVPDDGGSGSGRSSCDLKLKPH